VRILGCAECYSQVVSENTGLHGMLKSSGQCEYCAMLNVIVRGPVRILYYAECFNQVVSASIVLC
jgi:hypothetical protein